MEEENAFYNDFSSEDIKQQKKLSPKLLKLLIGISIIFVLIIVFIIILIIFLNSPKNNDNQKSLGIITCIYDIKDISKDTMILSNNFEKNSNFEIFINNKAVPYTKSYSFSQIGKNEVKFELYDDIQIDNMFKNISTLISVKMNSKNNLKILSMESTFENCEKLEVIEIKGFNTESIQSLKKTFYGCKELKSYLDGQLDTKNIKDMSFMFAESGITSIDLSKYNLDNVVNISYMFYKCTSLTKYVTYVSRMYIFNIS